MMRDERGATYVETLIAFPVVLIVSLAIYQFAYVCAAHLIVKRAASAAARAAIVFLSDDPAYYPDASAETRQAYVAEAARRVLLASAHFVPGSLRVDVSGQRGVFTPLTATVHTRFNCAVFMVRSLCGLDAELPLSARATLPYQQDAAAR